MIRYWDRADGDVVDSLDPERSIVRLKSGKEHRLVLQRVFGGVQGAVWAPHLLQVSHVESIRWRWHQRTLRYQARVEAPARAALLEAVNAVCTDDEVPAAVRPCGVAHHSPGCAILIGVRRESFVLGSHTCGAAVGPFDDLATQWHTAFKRCYGMTRTQSFLDGVLEHAIVQTALRGVAAREGRPAEVTINGRLYHYVGDGRCWDRVSWPNEEVVRVSLGSTRDEEHSE